MKLCGIKMTIEGEGGLRSPPEPFVTVEDKEGETLLALYPKQLRRVDVVEVVGEVTPVLTPHDGALPPEVEVKDGDAVAIVNDNGTAIPAVIEGGEPVPTGEPAIDLTAAPAEEVAPETPAEEVVDPEAIDADEAARLAAVEHPADLMEAFELLEADDFVKTGDRTGRPKQSAIKAILDRDVTVEEIDGAWAAKSAPAA